MSERNYNGSKTTYSRDEISAFTDRELYEAVNQMRNNIKEARRKGHDSTGLEIEFCYLDNERQRREKWGLSPVKPRHRREGRNFKQQGNSKR